MKVVNSAGFGDEVSNSALEVHTTVWKIIEIRKRSVEKKFDSWLFPFAVFKNITLRISENDFFVMFYFPVLIYLFFVLKTF